MVVRRDKSLFFLLFIALGALFTIFSTLLITRSTSPTRAEASGNKSIKIISIAYDNEVKSNFPNTVYSNTPYADVGSDAFHNSTMRYWLNINPEDLPKGKIIKVVLYLDRVSNTWDQDSLYRLHPALNQWDTSSLTWNNQPTFSDSYIEGVAGTYGAFSFDLTKFLISLKGKYGELYGFVLKKPNEAGNNSGLFATFDYSTAGAEIRPYLEITYSGK